MCSDLMLGSVRPLHRLAPRARISLPKPFHPTLPGSVRLQDTRTTLKDLFSQYDGEGLR